MRLLLLLFADSTDMLKDAFGPIEAAIFELKSLHTSVLDLVFGFP